MTHRHRNIVATALLTALTQLVAACSEGSADQNAPAAAMSGTDTNEPAMAIINSDAAPGGVSADDSEMLGNLLTTGADSDDAEAYWSCTTSADDQGYFVRYWSDGNGYQRENDILWQTTSADTAELFTAGDSVVLSDISFSDELVAFDRFMATRGASERIDCRWGGPSRYDDLGVQADSAGGLPSLLVSDRGSRDWSCTVDQPDGSITTTLLTYVIDRTGTGDTGAFNWYFDDDLLFMVADGGEEPDVFHAFSVVNADSADGPLSFTAQSRDSTVNCASDV